MSAFLPYGRQAIDDHDVAAVVGALRAELITQGPRVEAFEQAFAEACGAKHAVAFANGTAALHGAAVASGIQRGEQALTTPISFVASSNCLLYAGARPRFGDIDPNTLNLDPNMLSFDATATRNEPVKAVIAVSLAGLPADLTPFQPLRARGACVIEDASHALGARRAGRPVGGDGLADMTVFSLHPVKTITTGEGGIVTTESAALAERLHSFRTHGIRRGWHNPGEPADPHSALTGARADPPDPLDPLHGPWHYDVESLGFNYRITDFQCALGISQLRKLNEFVAQRNRVAASYRELLAGVDGVTLPPSAPHDGLHGYHLFVVRFEQGAQRRRMVCERLRAANIGTQLHYIPIYRHSLYRSLGYGSLQTQLPESERYYASALSLPIFPAMTAADVERVAGALRSAIAIPLRSAMAGALRRPMADASRRAMAGGADTKHASSAAELTRSRELLARARGLIPGRRKR